TIITESGDHTAQVANVIPPQKAGRIAEIAGAADMTGWCPIDPVTFASKLVPDIHVIGDACLGGGIPKSASAANAQAKACAAAVINLVSGRRPDMPKLTGACYSIVAPGYAFSLVGFYAPKDDIFAEVEGGGSSAVDAPRGRALVVDRSATCILCHSGPFPETRFQGDLAPSLAGAGSRWSASQLRLRIVDASQLNPATIMPAFYRLDGLERVGRAWR